MQKTVEQKNYFRFSLLLVQLEKEYNSKIRKDYQLY